MNENITKDNDFLDPAPAFHALIEGVREGAAIVALDRTILTCNRRLAQMLRLECEQVMGRSLLTFLSTGDQPRFEELLRSFPEEFQRLQVKLNGNNTFPLPVELAIKALAVNGVRVFSVLVTDLSRRRRAEEQFAFQAHLLANVSDAILAMDEQYRITYWNAAAERLYGYTAEEVVGRPAIDVIGLQLGKAERADVRRQLVETGRLQNQLIHHRRDGTPILVESTTVALYAPEGRLIGYVSAGRDITEQKRAGAALRESEERYRRMVETATEGIWIIDAENKTTFINPRGAEIFGYTPDEMLGRSSLEFMVPEDVPLGKARLEDRRRGQGGRHDYRMRRKDGSICWIHSRSRPILDDEGRYQGALAMFSDITERKRAEDEIARLNAELEQRVADRTTKLENEIAERKQAEIALRKRETTLAQAGQMAHLGAWDIEFSSQDDVNANPLTWSDEVYRIFGYAPGTVPVTNGLFFARVHPEDRQPIKDAIAHAIATQQPYSIEHRIVRPDGVERIVQEYAEVFFDERGQPARIVGAVQDITERKQIEQQIEQLNRDLERQAAELQSANTELESFSYSASHDLRTPLASMDSLLRVLLDDYGAELPEGGLRVVRLLQENTSGMYRLIEDLLAFAQSAQQPLKIQTINMTEMARQVFQGLAGVQPDRQVDFRISELPSAQADPALLKQVWVNLLSNAAKFTRGRAVARIEVGQIVEDPRNEMEGNNLTYYVRDNGAGFDMAEAENLFGVFRRLHSEEEFEGTGVGLAIVQRIIVRHGGRVWAEAQVDKGATFYFTLPE
ncbi:MAG: PAS domain S-box protein [Chloroflexi bacterium]|nr:PAS domain S-box protein [Chloroflexota bacterium]